MEVDLDDPTAENSRIVFIRIPLILANHYLDTLDLEGAFDDDDDDE